MHRSILTLAMTSPGRQLAFRRGVALHILLLSALGWAAMALRGQSLGFLGNILVVAGIVEGAALIGWRLAQVPKSQSLEFLLASPMRPQQIYMSEAVAGIGRLALVSLAGVPILSMLVIMGRLEAMDIPALVMTPFICGCAAGLGLTMWAYEGRRVRRWGERFAIAGILVYLVIGVLAAERLGAWLTVLPWRLADAVYRTAFLATAYNPFGALEYWLSTGRLADVAATRLAVVNLTGVILTSVFLLRSAWRFLGHFQDRHYRPAIDWAPSDTACMGDWPLTWWAVRRVMEYSGRMNIYLAGGFGLLYSLFLLLGDRWPVWMGRMVFDLFEQAGGPAALSIGLVVLAAVPAAFQYGLWDASTQDRCKKLELLLLTELDGTDFWAAALAAAWRRGRGYLYVAGMLWFALAVSGRAGWNQVLAAAAAAALLWCFSFALGFQAFSRGMHANGLGLLLTIGLPGLAAVLIWMQCPIIASWSPAGAAYVALSQEPGLMWALGPIAIGITTLILAGRAKKKCDHELRAWFDRNQGRKTLD